MTTVHFIPSNQINFSRKLTEIESGDLNITREYDPTNLIHREKLLAELKEWNRRKEFSDIILNKSAEDVPLKYIVYPFGYIAITLVVTLPLTTIPIHDIFENPEFFYEYPLQYIHTPIVLAAAFLLNGSVWINISSVRKWQNVALISAVGLVAEVSCYSLGYSIWTMILGLRYPIPFNAHLYWYIILTSQLVTMYFVFPKDLRENSEFVARLKNTMVGICWHIYGFTSLHVVLGALLLAYKNGFQWIIMIFIPWVREVSLWVMLRFTSKASSGDLTSTKLTCGFTFSVWHAVFQSYIIGATATSESLAVLLVEECMPGIWFVLKIIWINKKSPGHIQEQARLLQNLLIKEFVGFIVPLAFLLCFTVAFYGPNGDKIGNVRNSYFGYQAVEDFPDYTLKILSLFLIDFLTAIFGSVLLWKFCNINCYRGMISLQKEFGDVFLMNLVHSLLSVIL